MNNKMADVDSQARGTKMKGQQQEVRLLRVMSVVDVSAFIICSVIGSGIFISPKGVLALTGSPGMALVMWLVTGLISTVNALCYAELALTFPEAGSDYTYVREAFGNLFAFLFIWINYTVQDAASRAVISLTFATYFCQTFFVGGCQPPEDLKRIVAAAALSLLTAMHSYSSRWGVNTANFFTVAKVLGLVVIMVCGCGYLIYGNVENLESFMDGSSESFGDYVLSFYVANWVSSKFTRVVVRPWS